MAKRFSKLKAKPKRAKAMEAMLSRSRVSMLIDFRTMREAIGHTLRDCEEAAGIDHATLYRIEIGAEPSLPNAIRFAKFLGVPVEKIWSVKDAA